MNTKMDGAGPIIALLTFTMGVIFMYIKAIEMPIPYKPKSECHCGETK